MEAVPRMPMLSLELKHSTEPVEFSTTLKQYIQDHYNEDPANYNKACLELEQLRQNAVHVTHDFIGCSTLKKYYAQLQFLQSRFPLQDGGEPPLVFTWEDIQSGRDYSHSDIKFEQAAILYNIGALHSLLGAMDTRQSAEGMKVSCTHFQCAAWAFQYLRDNVGSSTMSPDMAHEILSFQIDLMLAQAQECILEKSMTDNRKSSITAKVAVQIVEFYRQALRNLETTNSEGLISSRRYKDWKRRIEIKILFYQTIMFYYLGCQAEEQQKHGERLAYFTAATDKLTQASKLAKNDIAEIHESLRFTQDVVGGKFNSAKKDNDFVYHEKVPAIDSLPEIKGASLVKGIPFNPNDPELSGPDIFQKLVPMEAHESSSLYSEEKAKLLREVGAEVDEKGEELIQFMTSLQLDEGKLKPEPERLPQPLLEKCAAISVRPNAVKDLVDVMGAVSGMATEVEMGLQEFTECLDEEDKAEEEYQKLFGQRARTIILPELRKECEICAEQHRHGSQSNAELHKAMNTHTVNLKLISGPLDTLQRALPSTELSKSPENEGIVNEVQRILNKVDEMRKQRLNLHNQFRDDVLKDDITNAIVTHEGTDTKGFFRAQLQKHDQVVGFLRQNLSAQGNILKALTEANAKFANIRKFTTESTALRESKISELIQSYDVYEDLMSKSRKGLEFYKKLESTVMRLLQRAKSIIKTNNEERDHLKKRFISKEVPMPRPVGQKPGSSTNLPPSSQSALPSFDGPKLKDYLPSMKPGTFGPKAPGMSKHPPNPIPHYPTSPTDIPDVIMRTDVNVMPPKVGDHFKIQPPGPGNPQPTSLPLNTGISTGYVGQGSNLLGLPSGYCFVDEGSVQPTHHSAHQPNRQPQTNPRVRQKFESTNTVSSVDTPIISPTKDNINGHTHNIRHPLGLRPQDFVDGHIPVGQHLVRHKHPELGPTTRFPQHHNYSQSFPAPSQPEFPAPASVHSGYSGVYSQTNQTSSSAPGQQPTQNPSSDPQNNTALYQRSYGGVQIPQVTSVNQSGTTDLLNYQQTSQYSSSIPGQPGPAPGHFSPMFAYQGQIQGPLPRHPGQVPGSTSQIQSPHVQRYPAPVYPPGVSQGRALNQPSGPQNSYQQGPILQSGVLQQIPPSSGISTSQQAVPPSQSQNTEYQPGYQNTVYHQTSIAQGQHYPVTSSPSQSMYRPHVGDPNLAYRQQIPLNQQLSQAQSVGSGGLQSNTTQWQQQQSIPNSGQRTGQHQLHQNFQQNLPQSNNQVPGQVNNLSTSMTDQHISATSQPDNMYSQQRTFSKAQQPNYPNQQQWAQSNPAASGWHGPGYQSSPQQVPQQMNQTNPQYQPYSGQTVPGSPLQSASRAHQLPSAGQPFHGPIQGQGLKQQPHQHIQPQGSVGQSLSTVSQKPGIVGQPQCLPGQTQPAPAGQHQLLPGQTQASLARQPQYLPSQTHPAPAEQPQYIPGQTQPAPAQYLSGQTQPAPARQPQYIPGQTQPSLARQPQYIPGQTQQAPAGQPQYLSGQVQQNPVSQPQYLTGQTQQGVGQSQQNQITQLQQNLARPTQQTQATPPPGSGQPQTGLLGHAQQYATVQQQQVPLTQTMQHQPQQAVQMQQDFRGHFQQGSVGQRNQGQPVQGHIGQIGQSFGTPQGFTTPQQQVPLTYSLQNPLVQNQQSSGIQQTQNVNRQSPQTLVQTPILQNGMGQPLQTNTGQQANMVQQPGSVQDNSKTILQPSVIRSADVPGVLPTVTPGLAAGGTAPETGGNRPEQTSSLHANAPAPTLPHHVLSRQSSTTSSFDDILSSSPENLRDIQAADQVLTPKILTAQELQQQKEEAMKLQDNQQPKDPFTVKETLERFVGEVERFEKVVENLCKPRLSGASHLLAEWKELSMEQEKIAHKHSIAVARCYIFKNRDPDIMPYDETRVLLKSGKDDYINASWMDDLAPSCPKFIGTQGPLPVTLVDFWLMVYEQGTEVIVMLSREDEPGKKTPVYWPTEKGHVIQHGPISLTLQSVKNKELWVERIIYLTHSETKQGRTIVHLQYMNWPVSGLPEKIPYILQFINEVQYFYKQQRSLLKPVIVHCSNGVGRTGTFLTIYTGIQEINKGNGIIDLPTIVTKMRSKRKQMITDMEHLKFCYQAILYHAQDELMKRGILTNKKTFSDKLPSPGEKSHSRKPSQDLIFNAAMGLHSIESNVAKFTSKHQHGQGEKAEDKSTSQENTKSQEITKPQDNNKSQDKPMSEEVLSSVTGQTTIMSLQTLPDLLQQPDSVSRKEGQSKVDMLCGLDTSQTVSHDMTGSVSGTQSLGGSPHHLSDQLLREQRSSLPPSLVDLQDPNTFTLDATTGRRRITKASFTQKKLHIGESTGDSADPLSNLDPLWTIHKANSTSSSQSS